MAESRTSKQVADSFNTTIAALITKFEQKIAPGNLTALASIERMKKRIRIVKQELGPEVLIAKAAPYLLKYQPYIKDRNEKFFIENDILAEYKDQLDQDAKFVHDIVDQVRQAYVASKLSEKDTIYNAIVSLVVDCIDYQLLKA